MVQRVRIERTQRDNQQWMLNLALNMRGRVQNFEREDQEVPAGKRARNYRMLPKIWREAAAQLEGLARRARAIEANETATCHYDRAIAAYRAAQFPIFYDDNPIKLKLWKKLCDMVDERSEVASYPIERIEVPFDNGATISCLFHLLPDRRRAPTVLYVPGMDQSKEVFPLAHHNVAALRGFHVLSMDGPGQGSAAIQKLRAVKDNYERAVSAVIDYLVKRPEVDAEKIVVYGISMGSYWSLSAASRDNRIAAVASCSANFDPSTRIFTQCSPRFKQMFMYMAGYEDEEKFDEEVAKGMTLRGRLGKITCPTLLVTGEFDPISPMEEALATFGELTAPKEMWVLENQYHPLWRLQNLGGLDCHEYVLDWLAGVLSGKITAKRSGRIAYIGEHGDGPFGKCEWTPPIGPGDAYF